MNRLGALIATGGTAEIYAWPDDRVVKLYWSGAAASAAAQEAAHAGAAYTAGAPTPTVIELVTVDGRPGVVFERAQGPSMQETLFAEPQRAEELARQFAELHADLHLRTLKDMPSQHQHLTRRIKLASIAGRARSVVLSALKALPHGHSLCHGDFHPGNVLLSPTGPTIIDWFDASIGDPVGDVARTCLVMQYAKAPDALDAQGQGATEALRSTFNAAYLDHYRRLRALGPEQLKAWMLPVASARLTDPISPHQRAALLRLIDGLLPAVTS
jgi:thiamine kinase